ncbi:MAG: S-methyl-5-thioribose-1-phosphate isomerase [Nanoarchaeota archaeon]|nr:S-methyl-5-thioribose-1-phosphate isomerase [Nanoarchaeota archaeon]
MDFFAKVVNDIKSVKIQGATNVAKYAVRALKWKSQKIRAKSKIDFLIKLEKYKQILVETRPTEPLMRNILRYVMFNLRESDITTKEIPRLIDIIADEFLFNMNEAKEKISAVGANMIKNHTVVFTHCHSSTVMGILKKAWKDGKRFEVIHTESRPLYQGHITAKELTKAGIPTTMIVDSAISTYIKKADMAIVGADVITADSSLINKIGTLYLALASKRVNIPFFSATVLPKFDPETIFGRVEEIEMRDPKEVWKNPPKKLKILNPAFDITPRNLINAYITEEGLVTPESVSEVISDKYSWILRGIKI